MKLFERRCIAQRMSTSLDVLLAFSLNETHSWKNTVEKCCNIFLMQMRPKETSSYPYFSLECHVILTDKAFDHLSLEICYTLN